MFNKNDRTRASSFGAILMAGALVTAASCKVDLANLAKRPSGDGGGGGATSSTTGGGGGGGDASGGGEAPRRDSNDHLDHMVVIEAEDGVKAVGPRKPAWCETIASTELNVRLHSVAGGIEQLLGAERELWQLQPHLLSAARGLCVAPDDAQVQEQTGYFLQYFVNRSGGTPEQVEAWLALFTDVDGYAAATKAYCDEHPAPRDNVTPKEKTRVTVERAIAGCERDPRWTQGAGMATARYDGYDRSVGSPSELARAMYVSECFVRINGARPYGDQDLARFATCRQDGEALDAKRLEKEIAQAPAFFQASARLQHASARVSYARHKALFEARIGDDKKLAEVFEVAPQRAWEGWKASAEQYPALYAMAFGFEDDPEQACWDDAIAQLKKIVKAAKAKDTNDVVIALATGPGAVAGWLAERCAKNEDDLHGDALGGMPHGGLGGPRAAVVGAMAGAGAELEAKGKSLGLTPGTLDGAPVIVRYQSPNDGAVVKAIERDGDGVRVTFKTEKVQVDDRDCDKYPSFYGWDTFGSAIWDYHCEIVGHHLEDVTHPEVWIPAMFADAIKPGVLLIPRTYSFEHEESIAAEVWSNKNKDKLLAFYGLPL